MDDLIKRKAEMSNLIDRRDAFSYFVTLWESLGTIMDREEWEDACVTTAGEIPSAQPEIIRCNECIFYDPDMGECDHRYGLLVANEDSFCSHAERRSEC